MITGSMRRRASLCLTSFNAPLTSANELVQHGLDQPLQGAPAAWLPTCGIIPL